VECQNVNEALEACAAGADIVMLDNCDHTTIGASASEVKSRYPYVLVEASGVSIAYCTCVWVERFSSATVLWLQGITQETMHLYMQPGVDIISRGSLTQGKTPQ
jgi:nicotinate-nucleotide pyrophosphorylase